jgi:hypothetical protein
MQTITILSKHAGWPTMTDIHTQMPNRLPETKCRNNWIAGSHHQIDLLKQNTETTELPNLIAKVNCQTELPNRSAKPNCQTELPNRYANLNGWLELPNWIIKVNRNCRTKFDLPKQNCQTALTDLIWHTESLNLLLTLPEWIYPFLCIYFLYNLIYTYNFYRVSQVWIVL